MSGAHYEPMIGSIRYMKSLITEHKKEASDIREMCFQAAIMISY